MSDYNTDPNFRYSNDNRDFFPGEFDYPSQHLAHKWALQSKLPSSHLYKNSEPTI